MSALSFARATARSDLQFYFFHPAGIEDLVRRALTPLVAQGVSIQGVGLDIGTLIAGPTNDRFARWCYARIVVPRLLHADFSRIIYLDSDTVVLGCPDDLVTAPLGNTRVILAAQDLLHPEVGRGAGLQSHPAFLGEPYFNAGVLAIDSAAWMEWEVERRAAAFTEAWPQFIRFADQCALNAAVVGLWDRLPQRLNVFPYREFGVGTRMRYLAESIVPEAELPRLERQATIYHFVGKRKPWMTGAQYPECASPRALRAYRAIESELPGRSALP